MARRTCGGRSGWPRTAPVSTTIGSRAFYDKKRREGKPHRVAFTAVARKLCHIVYADMRDGEPYDPAK